MNRVFRRVFAIAALLAFTAAAVAQGPEMPKPTPEHGYLKKMAGNWDATMRMKGMPEPAKCTAKYEMLGDFWLLGTFEGSIMGMKFTGKDYLGYDPVKKKYVGAWIDSMSPYRINMESTYNEGTKTMTATGDGIGMEGKPVKVKTTMTWKDDNTMNFTFMEGPDAEALAEMFTIEYKRRK